MAWRFTIGFFPRDLFRATVACFVLAALVGACLVPRVGLAAPLLGVVGVCASLGYSVSPVSLTRLGIADVVFFLLFGVVAVVGVYYVQARTLPYAAFVLGLPVGAVVTNVLLIDDMRDAAFDARKGWRTRPVTRGMPWTHAEFAILMIFAYGMPLWFWRGLEFSGWVLLPWITMPFAIAITRTVSAARDPAGLAPMSSRTAMLGLAYGALLAIGVAVS